MTPHLIAANGIKPSARPARRVHPPGADGRHRRVHAMARGRGPGAGCRVIERKLEGLLREQAGSLAREYGVDAIVNCTGLGAGELAGEAMYPLRGALIRVRNDGREDAARHPGPLRISRRGSGGEPGFIFIVPRGDDMLVLGGLAEPDEWGLDIGLHNYEPIRAMYQRCVEFMPILKDAEIDAAEPVPRRPEAVPQPNNVRLETEPGTSIIHNYGHGGSGVTLSWGCASKSSSGSRHCCWSGK